MTVTRTAAIEVQQLRKISPGGVEAVKGIDFEVPAGEVFGLLGPIGAGDVSDSVHDYLDDEGLVVPTEIHLTSAWKGS